MEKPFRYKKKLVASGGSFVILLPMNWLEAKNLTAGKEVVVEIYDDRVEIRPFIKK